MHEDKREPLQSLHFVVLKTHILRAISSLNTCRVEQGIACPGEWALPWTEEDLQGLLVSDLKQEIQGYDETARVVPGYDGTVINRAELTIEEMMVLYRIEIALALAARGERHEGKSCDAYTVLPPLDPTASEATLTSSRYWRTFQDRG